MREQVDEPALLHIVDGESVAGTLKESSVPGDVKVFGDLMYEGSTPALLSTEDWLEVRAQFLAQDGQRTVAEARRYLAKFEDTLAAIARYKETVLWLDSSLSDQLLLIRLLHWFGCQNLPTSRLSFIGADPTMAGFVRLGQLNAGQLATLANTRRPITDEQIHLGKQAWVAFTSPDPTEIESVIAADTSVLPFLAPALGRHLEQFPSVRNGLGRTERQVLRALQDGPLTAIQLFCKVQEMEALPFMGDRSFFRILTDLATVPNPLIRSVDGIPFDPYHFLAAPLTITDAGLRLLENRDDHIRLNGIDRWIGGVHLEGTEAAWRWDPGTMQIRSSFA